MLKDCRALRTVTDLLTEHLQTNYSDIDAIVGKFEEQCLVLMSFLKNMSF